MNVFTWITDGFYNKLRFDPFRTFREKEYSGKVERSLAGCQVHVLKESKSVLVGFRKILLVEISQEIPKPDGVEFVDPGLGRQFVRVKLVHTLKNAP